MGCGVCALFPCGLCVVVCYPQDCVLGRGVYFCVVSIFHIVFSFCLFLIANVSLSCLE